jgi:excisionase family DNA binding protein
MPERHVLKFTMANGLLEIQDATTAIRLLENEQRQRLAAEAEQAALSVCYRLSGEPDNSQPHGGLLTRRLGISESTARALITEGRLKYTCLGRKAYRVSESAVRSLLGDTPT